MPNIFIDNVAIDYVPNMNFLGIHFNQHVIKTTYYSYIQSYNKICWST